MASSTGTEKNHHTKGVGVGESDNSKSTTSSYRGRVYGNNEGQWQDKHSISERNKSTSLQDPRNGLVRTNSTRVRSSSVGKLESRKEFKNQTRAKIDVIKSAGTNSTRVRSSSVGKLESRKEFKNQTRANIDVIKSASSDDSQINRSNSRSSYTHSSGSRGFGKEPSIAEKKTNGYKQTPKFDITGDLNERIANAKIAAGGCIDSGSITMNSTAAASPNDIFFSRADFSPKYAKFSPLSSIYIKGKNSSEKSISHTPSSARLLGSSVSTVRVRMGETRKASSQKVKDPFRCNKNVWFSCMSGGTCMPPNNAPLLKKDKPFEIDNVSPRDLREIRISWADKHRPGSLAGFICHKQQAQLLKQLISQGNCPHILFQGPPGSGKRALTMALLLEIFGGSSWRVSHEVKSFDLKGKRHGIVSLPVASSSHHMELNVLPAAESSRYVLMTLIKELARNSEIALLEEYESSFAADYKVMVLYEVEKLSKEVQHIIKWMMDRYADAVKLVLCSDNDSSLVDALKNRCQVIKVDAPLTHEIMEVLLQIAKKERFDLPMSFAAHIASKAKQNLRQAIMSLEACKDYQYPFQEDQPIPVGWDEVVTEIATDILLDPTSRRVFIVRGKFQRLLSDCVSPKLIFQSLMQELIKRVPTSVKKELYYCYAYSEKHISKGNVLIKLEEFVAKVVSIYASYLKERSSTI